jgi:uncharacterized OB-fold protein
MSAAAPFAVLFVRLDDGDERGERGDGDLYMYGNLVGAEPGTITPGMPVEAVFVDIDDNLPLVQWRPRG